MTSGRSISSHVMNNNVLDEMNADISFAKRIMANATDYANHEKANGNRFYDKLIPRYKGYLPGAKYQFGERFAVVSKRVKLKQDALIQQNPSKFDVWKKSLRNETDRVRLRQHFKTPLKPIIEKLPPYYSKYKQQYGSPYTLPNAHPGKQFMTGYTGFIPRAEEYYGTQYPAITRRALCKFNEDMQLIKGERAKPIDLNKNVKKKSQKDTKTYHSDIGMAPQYSGHARGAMHMFGGLKKDAFSKREKPE